MKKFTRQVLIVGGLALAGCALACAQDNTDLTTVPRVDLKKYLGRWFEIARYPNRFQRKCAGDTSATYKSLPGGKIEVLNQCRRSNGAMDVAKGKARVVDSASNAKLRVTFFWPFSGNYWVIGLGPEYRWAIVGEPSRKFLWILCRTRQMDREDYEEALRVIRRKGYDPARLIQTHQADRSAHS
jgi:apolipoprotein D and lipocalin family protein